MWWFWVGTAGAVQVPFTVADLFRDARLVVAAEVTSTETRWASGDDGMLETEVWLAPVEAVVGELPRSLSVVLHSGSMGGVTVWTEHEPRLLEDHVYLLFLVPGSDGAWQVLGGEAGAWELRSEVAPNARTLEAALEVRDVD